MSFVTSTRRYMKFFYVFGQTLYPTDYFLCTLRKEHSKWYQFALKFPTILKITLNLASCVLAITLANIYRHPVKSYHISFNVYFSCEAFKVFAVLHRNFAYTDLIGEILQNFQSVEALFRSALQCPISFTSFKRAYAKKFCWAFGAEVTSIVYITIYCNIYGKIFLIDVLTELMRFFSIVMCMHVLLFVDLVAFYLKHLNTVIAEKNCSCGADKEYVFVMKNIRATDMICKKLSKYKMVYSQLWQITEQLNEYFGWTLLTIVLLSLTNLVIVTIWQLKILNEPRSVMRLFRKNCSESPLNKTE